MEIEDILRLMKEFDKSSLVEFKLTGNNQAVIFKKGVSNGQQSLDTVQKPVQDKSIQTTTEENSRNLQVSGTQNDVGASTNTDEGAENGVEIITSPIVGTFYRSPSPDSPPYVEAGMKAQQGDTLCILEAMKVMNEMEAEFNCEIVQVLAQNAEMVEYGTPLFEVKRI